MSELRGPGRAFLAAVLLMIGGILNIIYGISAIGKSHFFVQNSHYVFGSLRSWGWISLILGILELLAAFSLFRAGAYGRYFGIVVGSLAAIAALLEIPAYPFWSLAVFVLSLWIVHGLTMHSSDEEMWEETPSGAPRSAASSFASAGPPPPM